MSRYVVFGLEKYIYIYIYMCFRSPDLFSQTLREVKLGRFEDKICLKSVRKWTVFLFLKINLTLGTIQKYGQKNNSDLLARFL